MHERLDRIDREVTRWMEHWGHMLHRLTLAGVFVWFGLLKVAGEKTATSLLAHTIYLGSPEKMVVFLGGWEVAIGLCLLIRPFIRAALVLLAIRLPGTFLALIFQFDVCFRETVFVPTIEGQYLIKDMMLFAAAMVIGGTVRAVESHSGAKQPL